MTYVRMYVCSAVSERRLRLARGGDCENRGLRAPPSLFAERLGTTPRASPSPIVYIDSGEPDHILCHLRAGPYTMTTASSSVYTDSGEPDRILRHLRARSYTMTKASPSVYADSGEPERIQ